MIEYRGEWPRLVHLSADSTRDSVKSTKCPCGLNARHTMQSGCPPSYTEPRPGQCTNDSRKKLHALMMRHLRSIMRIIWMDKVTNKEILEQTGLPSMEDLLDWTPHEDITRQATKAGCILSIVFWSQKERAPSSTVQEYHQ